MDEKLQAWMEGIVQAAVAEDWQEALARTERVFAAGALAQKAKIYKAIPLLPKKRVQSKEGHIDWLIKMDDILNYLEHDAAIESATIKGG